MLFWTEVFLPFAAFCRKDEQSKRSSGLIPPPTTHLRLLVDGLFVAFNRASRGLRGIKSTMSMCGSFGRQLRLSASRPSRTSFLQRYTLPTSSTFSTPRNLSFPVQRRPELSKRVTGSQAWAASRRAFTASAQNLHGHLTPPKPGEEYDIFKPVVNEHRY